ncbi:hypothetical protein GYMLUDRAFT_239697 [Collybiopsis luxurians FD-317 M1]|nr:hypothetical protein GYMLUDRAFT_239697 [Collybiopsis luxurians FD-317 M1]
MGTSPIAEQAVQNEGNPEEIKALKAMGLIGALGEIVIVIYVDRTKPNLQYLPDSWGRHGKQIIETGSSISSFLLAMVMHPEVRARGQEEIDRVIGADRLPTFEDRR